MKFKICESEDRQEDLKIRNSKADGEGLREKTRRI